MNRERVLKLLEQLENANAEYQAAVKKEKEATQDVIDTLAKRNIAKTELDKALGLV